MGLTIRNHLVRLFSAAIIDQVLLSGANFLVGLVLIRFTTDPDYAIYVLLQTTLLLVVSAHSALVCGPLAILGPKKTDEDKQAMVRAVRASQNRVLGPIALAALLLPGLAYLTGRLSATLTLVITFAIAAGWTTVQRNYARNVLLLFARVRALVVVDSVYIVVLLCGMMWAAFAFGPPVVWIALTLAIAAWAGATSASRAMAKELTFAKRELGPVWPEMRALGLWALMGSVVYWIFSRSYNYILATRLDLVSVANVNEVRLLVVPAILVTVGLQGLLTPLAASWNAQVGYDGMLRRLTGLLLVVAPCELLYCGGIWLFRDWVVAHVLHKHIGALDPLLMLWVAVAVIALVRDVLLTAVYALGQLKWLAWQISACAAVSLLVMWFAIPFWGAAAALVAQIIGEILNLSGILYLIRKAQVRLRLEGSAACSPGP